MLIGAYTKEKIILNSGGKGCKEAFIGLAALSAPYRVGRARAVLHKEIVGRGPKRRNRMLGRQK